MRTERLLGAAALIGFAAIANVGCVAHARTGAYVEAGTPVVFAEPPTLVEVDSGVWVAEDADYPVYYYDDVYWVYRDNVWFRSDSWESGWARIDVNVVPNVIVNRNHPSYVHYRGTATARTVVAPRGAGMRPASRYEPGRSQRVDERRGPPEERGGPPSRVEERRGGGPPEGRGGPPARVEEHRGGGPPAERGGPPARVEEHRGGNAGAPGRGGGNEQQGQGKGRGKNKR